MFKIVSLDVLLKLLDSYNHTELHVHHTWRPNHANFNGNNGLELQQNMKNYHVKTNGWDDIAQHVTLLPDGQFVTGRDFSKQPASIKGFNGSNGKYPFMVEMIGDFDIGQDVLKGEQLKSILHLARYFMDKNKYIRFHRENSTKTCPGSSIDKEKFLQQVRDLYKPTTTSEEMIPSWAKEAIEYVKKEKIMNGYPDGSFKPTNAVTRAEMAVILYNLKK